MELTFPQPRSATPLPMSRIHPASLGWALVPVPGLIISVGASAMCYWQTGLTLGLFLAPLVLATIFAPCLILTEKHWRTRPTVLLGLISGPALVWLAVARNTHIITLHQVLLCVLVISAWLSVICGGSLTLRELRIVPNLAATVTVLMSFIWLTWPIWLSPALAGHQRAVAWLCWAHPIIAINSVVRQLGLWGSPMGGSDLAYRYLTILNQDVAYPQSQSIWPCVLSHGLVGVALMTVSFLLGRLRRLLTVIV
jgi:hypothetical protein